MVAFGRLAGLRPQHRRLGEPRVKSLLGQFLLSLGHVLFSMIAGALALAIVWIYLPSVALPLFRWATTIRDWVILANWPPRYEAAVRFFFDEHQIVYLGFVVASRILVGVVAILFAKWLARRPEPEFPI
jgi:hypothetical protein